MEGSGPYFDVVISSRVRLARNLADYPFPSRISSETMEEIVDKVEAAVKGASVDPRVGALEVIRLNRLSPVERQVMVEKHLISPQFAGAGGVGRAVALGNEEVVSVMINEEDHLRIQVFLPGMQLHEAWNIADAVDDFFEQKLVYAFDEVLGYLTCCPTNVGTGLRASVMLHLPGLALTGQTEEVLGVLSRVGLAVRGLFGEGTQSLGNIFQVSNQITLGRTEKEIISNLSSVTKKLIEQERSAREALIQGEGKLKLEDRVFRSYGILSNARTMSSKEALSLLSDLKLGIDLKIIKDIEPRIFNELIVLIQPGFIQHIIGRELEAEERDRIRADIIREVMARKEQ
ncbi:MAG: protein arginine kinase [Clostridia bacterium]|nr:protein arginine kinase [Clostridia bacterium]